MQDTAQAAPKIVAAVPDVRWLDNSPSQWITAGAVAVGVALIFLIVRRVLMARLKPGRAGGAPAGFSLFRSARSLAYELARTWLFLTTLMVAVRFGLEFLAVPDNHAGLIDKVCILLAGVQGVRWAPVFLDWAVRVYLARHARENGETDPAVAGAFVTLRWLGLFVVYSGLLLVILQNLDVDVTALITGLGIGGIAIALATQNILGDLFASLSITLDKPFVVGDFIVAGDDMGTIERIGVKTTRVRSLSGEQLVFANSDLLKSRIHNYKRMQERRVVFKVAASRDTPPEVIERIPGIIKEAIIRGENTRFDRAHFIGFGDSSLDFEACYYVLTADYNLYMDIQQAILLRIARGFAAEGIQMPYPTRTLYMHVKSMPHDPTRAGPDTE